MEALYRTMGQNGPPRSALRPAVVAYMQQCFPVELVARLLAAGARNVPDSRRHVARQSLLNIWAHEQQLVPRAPALETFLLNAPPPGGFDAWVALHVGAAVRDEPARAHHELVLDLDLCDWDTKRAAGIRRDLLCDCGAAAADAAADKKACCRRCWCLVELAAVAIARVCEQHLALGAPLWVFSGGKGAHAWFGSEQARRLDASARKTLLAEFADWHASACRDRLARATEDSRNALMAVSLVVDLRAAWRRIVVEREAVFERDAAVRWAACFLDLSPDRVPAILAAHESSEARWSAMESVVGVVKTSRLVLEVALPVVDLAVLRAPGHLAKAPFSVHAGSDRLALPLAQLAAFDPQEDAVRAHGEANKEERFVSALRVFSQWLEANTY